MHVPKNSLRVLDKVRHGVPCVLLDIALFHLTHGVSPGETSLAVRSEER